MNRDDAWQLVCEYTTSDSLRRHMLAVETAMRAYAAQWGEDVEKYGIVGLLHDFDYERWPDPPAHPLEGAKILTERGYPADVIYAIKSHADYLSDCPRVSRLDKTLYACDELSGFIVACAMVRPERLQGLEAKSIKKKLKAKGFAAAVKRAGLDDVTPHDLRHTAAVWMAEAGASMAEIAQVLGHSDERITYRVYARFSPDHLRRAMTALEF